MNFLSISLYIKTKVHVVLTLNYHDRFKLHLIVHDDTGDCKLVLLGSIAKSIIGFEAQELWDGSYEEVSLCLYNLNKKNVLSKFLFFRLKIQKICLNQYWIW